MGKFAIANSQGCFKSGCLPSPRLKRTSPCTYLRRTSCGSLASFVAACVMGGKYAARRIKSETLLSQGLVAMWGTLHAMHLRFCYVRRLTCAERFVCLPTLSICAGHDGFLGLFAHCVVKAPGRNVRTLTWVRADLGCVCHAFVGGYGQR